MKVTIINIVTMETLGNYIDMEEAKHARNEFELIGYIHQNTDHDDNTIWMHKDTWG